MNPKVIWQKPKDYVPTIDVVSGRRAKLFHSVNHGIDRAERADRELKLNIAKDHE